MHHKTTKRRRLSAHINCWYCGHQTWHVYVRPHDGHGAWRQKPPWIRLGACCRDADLALSYIGSSATPAISLYQVPLDDLSPTQLRRRLRSKPLPGAKRDPTRAERARLARWRLASQNPPPPHLVSEQ
jgi:hypothetical protein